MAVLHALHWNVAGSDVNNGYGARNSSRGDEVGRYARDIGFDIFLACEAGQKNLRTGINKIIGASWSRGAKAIWKNSDVKRIRSNRLYGSSLSYLGAKKWAAAAFGEIDGSKFAILEVHTDYRKPAKQAKQLQSMFKKFLKEADRLEIHRHNVIVVGDFNWDGSKGDNPFRALLEWGFVEHGNRSASTFISGKHLDGVLAHINADLVVKILSRRDLSDHNPIKVTIKLK